MNNLSLFSLLKLALKYLYLLIAVALVSAILAFSYCKFLAAPKYSATGSLVVTNGAILADRTQTAEISSQNVSGTDISASLQLSNTVIDILKTNDIYKMLAEQTGDKYTYSNLIDRCTINRRNTDTLFIDVSFTAATSAEARELVNGFLTLVPDYILRFIPNSNAAVTTTADKAVQTYPRTLMTTLTVSVACTLVCFAIIYVISIFNTTIKNEDDINEHYDLIVLGDIPDFAAASSKNYYKYNSYTKGGGYVNAKR